MGFSKVEFTIQTLEYLAKQQKNDGSFQSMESYPSHHPLGPQGWQMHDPSPFIHANILINLIDVDHPIARDILQKGLIFIESLQEHKGFWRFWPHEGNTHNVPLDMDDTALCSFLLEKNGTSLSNKKLLLRNQNNAGYFRTWILPQFYNWRSFSFRNFLKRDYANIQQTMASPMLDAVDYEPAVAANVLLYLGEQPETEACIQLILTDLKDWENMPLQYYQDPIVIFYHVARAYYHGVSALKAAIPTFEDYLKSIGDTVGQNPFLTALAMLCMQYFDLKDHNSFKLLKARLEEGIDTPASWQPHIYFVSKDRNFRAGSPELTAAVCLAALSKS